jgi:hypothetical protein
LSEIFKFIGLLDVLSLDISFWHFAVHSTKCQEYSRLPGSVPGGRVLIKVADLSALLDATREVSAGHHHYVRV